MASSIAALLSRHAIDKREAQLLLAHALGVSRASIIAHPQRLLDAAEEQLAQNLIERRAAGEPIAYLIGRREFYGRDFVVSPATLIPRPETELIIEQALARLNSDLSPVSRASASVSPALISQNSPSPSFQRRLESSPLQSDRKLDGLDSSLRWNDESACHTELTRNVASVLDLGAGSGVIAVSLALECPDAMVVAADISRDALSIATENARRLDASVEFVESNWYARLEGRKFDLIVANPPYIAAGDAHLSQGDLRFEPQIALTDESSDGLRSIRTLIQGAPTHLHPGGWLLFEHGYDQADACRGLLLKAGFENLISVNDLAGISRVAGGQIG